MQKLAEICVKRPVFAVMLIMAMVVVGAVSYSRLGVDRFPDVDLPIVSVRTTLLGASPEEMESTVTRRIEDAVATVEGIDDIRSTSTESLSIVTITFGLNRNIDVAAQDVRDAVASVIALLPRDAKPPLIRKLDTDASPILTLVVSGTRTPRELYEIADRDVKDSIESVGGVGQAVINGGQKRAVNVWIDADRLAAYKIPILQVRDAVARQNSEIPGGRVDEGATRTRSPHPRPLSRSRSVQRSRRRHHRQLARPHSRHRLCRRRSQRTAHLRDLRRHLRRSRLSYAGNPAPIRSTSSTMSKRGWIVSASFCLRVYGSTSCRTSRATSKRPSTKCSCT